MPNLVGIGNSQVPTNAMLGGLAYQDSVGEIDIDKIKARIGDAATDIFVYDTSKDSDGGAWRKKATKQSWYNEGVSKSRGARKEFPAVAVIVVQYENLTIYDGDDPNLPMWMDFDYGSSGSITNITMLYANGNATSALNGIICSVGSNGWHDGMTVIDFIRDTARWRNSNNGNDWSGGIATRNTPGGYGAFYNISSTYIASATVNDVAMTVFPNSKVSQYTGLPVPTIVLGTSAGVSIVHDIHLVNATVVDLVYQESNNKIVNDVDVDSDGRIYWTTRTGVYFHESDMSLSALATSDISAEPDLNMSVGQAGVTNAEKQSTPRGAILDIVRANDKTVLAFNGNSYDNKAHLFLYNAVGDRKVNSSNNSLDNLESIDISTDYNTGYMFGDIKGAFLSDTVTEKDGVNYALSAQYDGTNRLTSQTYGNGATSWQMVDNAGNNNGYVVIAMKGLTVGQKYKISMTWDNNATLDANYYHRVAHKNGTADENDTNFDHWNKTNGSSETLTGVFVAQTTDNDDLVIYANAITLNVSDFKIEETDGLSGRELVTNPGPFTSTTGWAAANAGWSVSDSNNRLVINSGSQTSSYFGAAQTLTLVDGKKYVLVVNIHSQTKTAVIRLTADGNYFTSTGLGTGEHSFYFTANQATHSIFIGSDTGGTNREQQINYVNIRDVDENRIEGSYGKGLEVYGSITREPVADGAELLSYSGVNASNYLRQPYNSDLNFGTGDFSIFVWVKKNNLNTNHYVFDRARTYPSFGGSSGRAYFIINSNGYHRYKLAGGSEVTGATKKMPTGSFNHIGFVRRSGVMEFWMNGDLVETVTGGNADASFDGGTNNQTMTINRYSASYDYDYGFDGMALLRISGTAPNAEQIRKAYVDEKCLFNKNAKCTLYGTMDQVKAVAYDDKTGILHAGASSGRSDFSGLIRINNTTTAVSNTISASNGLVAES